MGRKLANKVAVVTGGPQAIAKGLAEKAGEIPIRNVGAAVACAVARATGKPVRELPLTPPRVLALLINDAAPLTFSNRTDS